MNRMSSVLSSAVPVLVLATAFTAAGVGAAAQTPPGNAESVPEGPPAPPPRVESGKTLEPEAPPAIAQERGTITEYRVNGHLRAIEVATDGFPTYWLIDVDGDGQVDTDGAARLNGRAGEFDTGSEMRPHWRIFSW